MSETRGRIPFVAYDADGRIGQDLACLECGYNLRGLLDDGQCPECGASVHQSARLAWLCQHDPAWLRRLARATIWMAAAMVCLAALPVLVLMEVLVGPVDGNFIRVWLAVPASGVLAGLQGSSELTAPHLADDFQRRVRSVARWLLTAGLIGLLVLVGLFLLSAAGSPWTWSWLVPSLALSVMVSMGVGVWAMLVYAAALAAKVPEPRLVRHVRLVAWGFALCFLAMGAAVMMGTAEELWAKRSDMEAIMIPVLVAAFAALLVLSIWTIPLLVWYRRRFREAAAMAAQHPAGSG